MKRKNQKDKDIGQKKMPLQVKWKELCNICNTAGQIRTGHFFSSYCSINVPDQKERERFLRGKTTEVHNGSNEDTSFFTGLIVPGMLLKHIH